MPSTLLTTFVLACLLPAHLLQGVARHGACKWAKWVPGHMNGRTSQQSRDRWVNSVSSPSPSPNLNPSLTLTLTLPTKPY